MGNSFFGMQGRHYYCAFTNHLQTLPIWTANLLLCATTGKDEETRTNTQLCDRWT